MLRSILALALFASPSAAQEDRLLVAICGKTFEELKQTVAAAAARGATMDLPEDADHETLMAALYTKSQGEIPGGGDPKPWPGCDGVPKPKAAPRFGGSKKQEPAAAAKKPEDMLDQMASMLFKTRDADKDGKLSAEEMKTILDQVNAKAKAAGEPEVDFFKAADKDGDGFLDYDETQKFFSSQMASAGTSPGAGATKPAKAAKAAPTGGASASAMDPEKMPELMFKNLDKNGDGSLSRAEMQNIIDQTNKQSANQQAGESGDDFFASLDKSGDGSIDKEEATAFFKSVAAMMGGGGGDKDEV